MKRNVWSILLIFAMLLSLAACGQKKTTEGMPQETQEQGAENQEPEAGAPAEEKGDTLVVRAAKDIGDMNPHTMKSQMFAQDWVYESLVAMKNGEIVPELAERWEVSEDGKTYTFHLRDNVKFSDGSDFNSKIAKKNIEAVMARIRARFSQEEVAELERLLGIVSQELMPEVPLE